MFLFPNFPSPPYYLGGGGKDREIRLASSFPYSSERVPQFFTQEKKGVSERETPLFRRRRKLEKWGKTRVAQFHKTHLPNTLNICSLQSGAAHCFFALSAKKPPAVQDKASLSFLSNRCKENHFHTATNLTKKKQKLMCAARVEWGKKGGF